MQYSSTSLNSLTVAILAQIRAYHDFLEEMGKHPQALEALRRHLSLVDVAHVETPICITFEPEFEYKARHLWEELVGKYKAQRNPVAAVLFPHKTPFPKLQTDFKHVIHFGNPASDLTGLTCGRDDRSDCTLLIISNHFNTLTHTETPTSLLFDIGRSAGLAGLSFLVHLICEAFEPHPTLDLFNENSEARAICQSLCESSHPLYATVDSVAATISGALERGGLIFLCGNGGSACDTFDLRASPPAVHLAESGYITCVANDFGYDEVFARAVATCRPQRDILVALSTSGRSKNILKALETATLNNVSSILLSGESGGLASSLAEISLLVPSQTTARIQELHSCILEAIETWLNTTGSFQKSTL